MSKMTILRELTARVSFKTDTSQLEALGQTLSNVKKTITGIAATALSSWAIKAGGDVDFLNQQVAAKFGPGLETIRKTIDKLGADKGGLKSIFSEPDLLKGALALRELGFNADDASALLDQASILTVRSGKGIAETAREIGAAIQEGGLPQLLRQYALISRITAEDFGIVEAKIGESAKQLSARATREFRESLLRIFQGARGELEAETARLEQSPAGAQRRLGAQMETLWTEVARVISETVEPVLNKISGIMGEVTKKVRALRDAIKEAGGPIEALFVKLKQIFPEHENTVNSVRDAWRGFSGFVEKMFEDKLVEGSTIGGMIMFLLTRNPAWLLGSLAGGVLLSMIADEWSSLNAFLSNPLKGNILAGATIGGLLMFLVTRNPAWLLAGAAAGATAAGSLTQAVEDIQTNFEGMSEEQKLQRIEDFRSGKINPLLELLDRVLGTDFGKQRVGGQTAPATTPSAAPQSGRLPGGGSVHDFDSINFNINIEVKGAQDPELVGRAVVREFRNAINDLSPALEFKG